MSSPGIKPESQLKVILLSFFSIGILVVLITVVSLMTTQSMAGHHGAGGDHGEGDKPSQTESHDKTASHEEKADAHATDSHEKAAEDKAAAPDAHKTEEKHEEAKTDEHAAEKPAAPEKTETAASEPKEVAKVSGDPKEGAKVFMAKTCATCHAVSSLEGAKGAVGPKLDGLAETAKTRQPGVDALTYVKQSIEEPNAFVVKDFPPAMAPLRATMSDKEYEDLLAFLMTL